MNMIHNIKINFLKFRLKKCYYCGKINFLIPMLSCSDCSAVCHRRCQKKYMKTEELHRSLEVVLTGPDETLINSVIVAPRCILNTVSPPLVNNILSLILT